MVVGRAAVATARQALAARVAVGSRLLGVQQRHLQPPRFPSLYPMKNLLPQVQVPRHRGPLQGARQLLRPPGGRQQLRCRRGTRRQLQHLRQKRPSERPPPLLLAPAAGGESPGKSLACDPHPIDACVARVTVLASAVLVWNRGCTRTGRHQFLPPFMVKQVCKETRPCLISRWALCNDAVLACICNGFSDCGLVGLRHNERLQ